MLWLLLLFLHTGHILAPPPGPYRGNNYYGPRGNFNMRYGSKYPQRGGYQNTAVSVYPRCRSDFTILDVVILDEKGKSCPRAKLWYGSTIGLNEVWTANNGRTRVKVTGCEAGLIAWTKDQQAEYKKVNLEECEDKVQNVVIQTGKACNFVIYVQGDHYINDYAVGQTSSYIEYIISSGGQTTSGSFVGGVDASPICVPIKSDASLYMVITSQASDYPNILYLSSAHAGGDALISDPLPISLLLPEDESVYFALITNVWQIDSYGGVDGDLEEVHDFKLVCSDGTTIEGSYSFTHGIITDEDVYGGLDKSSVCLVVIDFDTGGEYYKGNAVLSDRKGNTRVVEFPSERYDGECWVPGCLYGDCLDNFKERSDFFDCHYLPYGEEIEDYCEGKDRNSKFG